MKNSLVIVLLSFLLGLIVGYKASEPQSVPPLQEQKIKTLQDSVKVLTNTIDSLESVQKALPEPPPPSYLRETKTKEDSLKFYAEMYPILYEKYQICMQENLQLRHAVRAQAELDSILEAGYKEINIAYVHEKRKSQLLEKVLIGAVAVTVAVLLSK